MNYINYILFKYFILYEQNERDGINVIYIQFFVIFYILNEFSNIFKNNNTMILEHESYNMQFLA